MSEDKNKTTGANPADNTADRLAALEKKISEQDKTIQQHEQTISALSGQLKKASATPEEKKDLEKPKLPKQEFKIGKDTYKFVLPQFRHGGQLVTAIDALNDKDLLADLVKKGSGVIKQVF